MEEEEVNVGIWEGDMHFNLSIPKSVDEKMSEIRSRNPQLWKGRDFDLMQEANKELEEQQSSQPSQPESEQ